MTCDVYRVIETVWRIEPAKLMASLALEIKRELAMSDFDADLDDDIGDDLLRLTFVACHPALSTEAAWSV